MPVMFSEVIDLDGNRLEQVPADDRGLMYGDGLFETIRIFEGGAPLFATHMDRLSRDAKVLGINADREQLTSLITGSHARMKNELDKDTLENGLWKIILTRGSGGFGYNPINCDSGRLLISFKPMRLTEWYQEPVNLVLSPLSLSHNPELAGMKHLNKLDYVIAAQRTERGPNDLVLITDQSNRVVEALHHNVFILKNDYCLTPGILHCGVRGVMRQVVLDELCPGLGIKTSRTSLSLEELQQAEAIFMSNSVRGIVPVAQMHDNEFDLEHPRLNHLRLALNEYIENAPHLI